MANETTNRPEGALYAANTNTGSHLPNANGGVLSPIVRFGGSTQPGIDFSKMDSNDIATLLGTPGYTPSYNSNKQGSFEGNYNNVLSNLTPEQMIKRYSVGNAAMYQTPLDQQNYQAYSTAKSIFGRELTPGEFSQILPSFQGPNGLMNGRAFVANLQQQYKANPALDPTSPQNNLKPGDIQGQVSQQFSSILGRAPTQDELSHFSQAIQTGQTDAYGLGSFLKQMPEYTNTQDTNFRNSLNDQLTNYDTKEFGREKQDIIGQFMRNGTYGSSALDSALTDLMGQIADKRSSYLAQLSSAQYGGNKDLATKNYQNTLDQLYGQNQSQRQNQQAYGNQLLNQGFQGADYQTQRNDYMNFLNSQPKQSMNPITGALMGAGSMAATGNPYAIAGAGLFGYLGSR